MLAVVAGLCLITTTLAYVSTYFSLPWVSVIGVILALGLLILTRSFGHAESKLVVTRAFHFFHSFSTSPNICESEKQHRKHALQGSGSWETVWEPIVELAQSHELASIKIDLNLAWLHEGYHASWHSVRLPEKAHQLTMCVPLFTRRTKDGSELVIGRLELVASAKSPQIYAHIAGFIEQLSELNPQIDHVIESLEKASDSEPGAFFWPKPKGVVTHAEQVTEDSSNTPALSSR